VERIDPILGIDDTHPKVRALMLERQRRMSVGEKLAELSDLIRTSHHVQVAGLRERFPHACEDELAFKAGAIRVGVELARTALGNPHPWLEDLRLPDPLDDGRLR
jgi:hypothetical protein